MNHFINKELIHYKNENNNPAVINCIRQLDEIGFFDLDYDIRKEILTNVKKLLLNKPITKIDLTNETFNTIQYSKEFRQHDRCLQLFTTPNEFKPFNDTPWGYTIRHIYNNEQNKEIELTNYEKEIQALCTIYQEYEEGVSNYKFTRLYFSTGGIVQGKYLDICYIKPENYKDFDIDEFEPINIPISIIEDGIHDYYIVDIREPKLKELMNKYNCRQGVDDTYFNIRKFIKL